MSFNLWRKVKEFLLQPVNRKAFCIQLKNTSLDTENQFFKEIDYSFLQELETSAIEKEDVLVGGELLTGQLLHPLFEPTDEVIHSIMEVKPILQPMPIDMIGEIIILPPRSIQL